MANITNIKEIDTKVLQKILIACEKSFTKELSVEEFYSGGQTTWAIPEIGLSYEDATSKTDLLTYVETLTGTENIRQAYAIINTEIEARKLIEKETVSEYQKREQTTIAGEEARRLEEELVALETSREKIKTDTEKEVERALEQKVRNAEKARQIQEQKNQKVDLTQQISKDQPDSYTTFTQTTVPETTVTTTEPPKYQTNVEKKLEGETQRIQQKLEDIGIQATEPIIPMDETIIEDKIQKTESLVSKLKVPGIIEQIVGERVPRQEVVAEQKKPTSKIQELSEKELGLETPQTVAKLSQKEINEQIDKIEKIVVIPTEKIHTVTLTNKEKEELFNLKQAFNYSPATVKKTVEEKITQSVQKSIDPQIKENITPEVISKTAYSITQNIENLPSYQSISEIPTVFPVIHPSSPIVAMSNIKDKNLIKLIPQFEIRREIVDKAQTIAIALDTERSVNIAGSNAALGSENITAIFYGDNSITQFQVSDRQEEERDEGIEIDPQEIYKQGKDINNIWKKLINKTATVEEVSVPNSIFLLPYAPTTDTALLVKSSSLLVKALPYAGAAYGLKQGILIPNWVKAGTPITHLLSQGNQQFLKLLMSEVATQEITTSSMLVLSKPIGFQFGKFAIAFSTGQNASTGLKLAVAGIKFGEKESIFVALKGGTQAAIVKVSEQTGSKIIVGASKLLTKALTFLGGLSSWATGGISLVVGWLLGKLIERVNWKKLWEKFKEYLLPVLAVGGGLLMGGPVGIAMFVGGGLMLARGLRNVVKWGSFFAGLGAMLGGIAIRVATPIIITLLIIPPTVAFIMFVINSGAYVVPPSAINLGGFTSPYVDITKTANPPGPFANTDLPKTITYKVSVIPKRGNLTNVKLTYDCKVISKSSLNCPAINLENEYKDIFNQTLDFVEATGITFTYTSTYNSSYKDSAIIDSIKLVASSSEEQNVAAEVSASVTFGAPPISCPVPGAKPLNSMNYSYNSATDTGHGSTAYWIMMGGAYQYPLPQMTSCLRPTDCSYYGYAYDVYPTGTTEVFAPSVGGKNTTWNCSYGFSNGSGSAGYSYVCISSDFVNVLVLTHMNIGARTGIINTGEKIGSLFSQSGNTHLHIEFQTNGRWVKPENYFCTP